METVDPETLNLYYQELEKQALELLRKEEVAEASTILAKSADLRYSGQAYELNIPVPSGRLTESHLAMLRESFHATHERVYGHSATSEPVELVNVRVMAIGRVAKPRLRELESGSESPQNASKGERSSYFDESRDYVKCPTYDRYRLRCGNIIRGPAIIEEIDSTTIIYHNQTATVDKFGNILVKIAK